MYILAVQFNSVFCLYNTAYLEHFVVVVVIDININIYITADFFVTWGARSESGGVAVGAGAPLPPNGKPLGKLSGDDLKAVIEKGFKHFSKLSYTCSMVIIPPKLV